MNDDTERELDYADGDDAREQLAGAVERERLGPRDRRPFRHCPRCGCSTFNSTGEPVRDGQDPSACECSACGCKWTGPPAPVSWIYADPDKPPAPGFYWYRWARYQEHLICEVMDDGDVISARGCEPWAIHVRENARQFYPVPIADPGDHWESQDPPPAHVAWDAESEERIRWLAHQAGDS